MLKNILQKQISFPVAAAIIMVLGISSAGLFFIFRNKIYQYQLLLQDDAGSREIFDLEYGSLPQMSDENFFARTKKKLISEKAEFIEANLSEMKISLYQSGNATKEFQIIGKGKEGSWWETPAGIYKIELKEKLHFSSIGQVYM